MIEAFILAAGASSRFVQSKALVQIRGQTVLERVAGAFLDGGVSTLKIVCREEDEAIQSEAIRLDLPIVYCTPWTPEMSSSVCTVLNTSDADWIAICPVDLPFLQADTVKACLASLDSEALVVQPWCDGYKHPVFLSAQVKVYVLDQLSQGFTLREVLNGLERRPVPVPTVVQFRDFNTREELARLLEEGEVG